MNTFVLPALKEKRAQIAGRFISLKKQIARHHKELASLDATIAPSLLFNQQLKLLRLVHLVAATFVYFLEIHPFANGNGHIARLFVILLFVRYGVYPKANWALHPRPKDPPYSDAIKEYRNGNKTKLHVLFLDCL